MRALVPNNWRIIFRPDEVRGKSRCRYYVRFFERKRQDLCLNSFRGKLGRFDETGVRETKGSSLCAYFFLLRLFFPRSRIKTQMTMT